MWQDRGESGLRGSVSRALCAVHGCDNALELSGVLSHPWETARDSRRGPWGQGAAAGPQGRMVRVPACWPRRPEMPDTSALQSGARNLFRDDRMVHWILPQTRRVLPGARAGLPGMTLTAGTGAAVGPDWPTRVIPRFVRDSSLFLLSERAVVLRPRPAAGHACQEGRLPRR